MKEKEMLGGCCVCSDERGWPDNPLVYCDGNGCSVAVHQACYGIVTVPTGPWYCRKCESPDTKGRVRCDLCPSKSGALKRSDTGGWAHVVCALYIPEVRFGNVTSMEPIVLRLIPPERYNKVCYICQDLGKTHRATAGACMQCNKTGCKQQFHVTCAQSLGLLCEEAGNYLDNVKYCGYCQHHYSKLKKGGNVKTIPPYKPVMHDSHSSDSSGEKDGGNSPLASESGTPTHLGKSKGPGRKSSHSSNSNMGKNTPNSSKTPTNSSHAIVKSHHGGDKGKKSSPSRRGSSTGELAQYSGSGSKSNTPAPSPQHAATTNETNVQPQSKTSGGSTPKNTASPRASPSHAAKSQESMSVISSISSATYTCTSTPNSSANTTSVVQASNLAKPLTSYQESVITNAESIENKHTKKRKAINAANAALDYPAPPATPVSDLSYQPGMSTWENNNANTDIPMENLDKIIKKAKTEPSENPSIPNYQNIPLPPPLPVYSPSSQRSPRVHANTNPVPGLSGVNNPSNIRSPSQPLGGKGIDRDSTTSLLVSVPLPSTSQGLNLSAHSQISGTPNDSAGPSTHIFHQMSKHTATEQSAPGHPGHAAPGRSAWAALSVAYDAQQLDSKPGYSAIPSTSKEPVPSTSGVGGSSSRSKKRSPMGPSVVGMANTNASAIQTTSSYVTQRQAPQPTPPPVYHETIKDSPPTSPGMERAHKGKIDKIGTNCSAPHMLGNELNPESGAAARLQQQLTAELAAHAQGGTGPSPLVPPPLINKATHGPSGSSKGGSCGAQSLDQLLERQWEQGSQFLMEQAQHFDIASLLSCLHQLRTENVRLEEHVSNLLQRRDHLLAVNARLAIPLTAVTPGPSEPPRCPRDSGPPIRGPPVPVRNDAMQSERHQLMMREVQQKPS